MKNRTYHLVILFAVISPLLAVSFWAVANPNADTIDGLTPLFGILGVPVVGVIGLLISGVLAFLKVKNRNWSLAGYIIPAALTSWLIFR